MNTYWNHKGKYQEIYGRYQKLIPEWGKASSYSIEVLRCFSNIYYDIYNNDGCNLDCPLQDQVQFLNQAREWIKWYSGEKRLLLNFASMTKEELERLADTIIFAVDACRSLGLAEDDPRKEG